ncbi:MAG: ABC transporter substrate-binding protein [Clostridia bacterium]
MKKLIVLILSLMMVCMSFAGCTQQAPEQGSTPEAGVGETVPAEGETSSAEQTAVRKDTLVVAIQAEPQTMDPYAASHDTTFVSSETIFESLLKSVDGELTPWLAESYEIVDDLTIVFHLRDDVYFHDGNKMTADDVVFSLGYAATSSFTSTMFGAIDIENTKALDEKTVEVKLKYAYAPLMEGIASYRGVILSKAAFESMGVDAFGRAPVGTGPMMFKDWINGDRIELVGFDKYWGEKPMFDNMTIRIILEASSRSVELETGGVDIAFQIAPVDWTRLAEGPDTQMLTGNSMGMTYLCFNNSNELYGNELVRKAIAYAINVEAVAKTAYQGQADAADGFIARSIPGYKKVGPWEYNPEKSKELLKEAGYENGLEVKFVTFQQQYYNACIEIIQSMLKEVGITCTIDMVDLATFTSMNNAGELPMTVMANSASIPDPASALVAWPLARTISLRHNDQHVQDLLDKGERTYALEDRIPIYEELQDYLWEKLYLLPLVYPITGYGARANIKNFNYVPTGIPDFAGIVFAG